MCPCGHSLAAADAEIGGPNLVIDVPSETVVIITVTDEKGPAHFDYIHPPCAELPEGVNAEVVVSEPIGTKSDYLSCTVASEEIVSIDTPCGTCKVSKVNGRKWVTSAGYNSSPDSGPSNVVAVCSDTKCNLPYLPLSPDIVISVGSVHG